MNRELIAELLESTSLEALVDDIAVNIPFSLENRQQLLEAISLPERYVLVEKILTMEVQVCRIKQEFRKRSRNG